MENKNTVNIAIIAGIVVAIAAGVGALFIIAPWKGRGDNGNISDTNASYNTKGKCKFYECLSKVTGDSTEEEVEAAFGFAPKTETDDAKKTEKHTWAFDDDHSIVMNVSTYSGKKNTVSIKIDDYEYDDVKQKGVVFDKVSEIKANLNKGDGVSYEKFKEYMGGVDGILTEVGSNKKYEWRSADSDGYITGTFNSDGRCTFMNGITY
jgi:hypothetical protein